MSENLEVPILNKKLKKKCKIPFFIFSDPNKMFQIYIALCVKMSCSIV